MKKYVVQIEACNQCMFQLGSGRCTHRPEREPHYDDIPDWCPLEDV